MRKRIAPPVVVVATLLALTGIATGAPGIAITSPADGSTVAGGSTAVAGTVSFTEPVPEDRTFYMRRTGCDDDKRLSIVQGSETSGCAYTASITPLNEDSRLADEWPAVDGVPFTLDATREITGVITLSSYQPPVYAGAGATTVDISVLGFKKSGGTASLGSTTVSYVATPGQNHSTDWEITPPAELDGTDFNGLTLSTTVRGVNVLHGFTIPNQSNMTLPIYSASFDRAVEISVDGGAFSSEGVALSEDLSTFDAAVTLAAGDHAIGARAVQGGTVIATDGITVTASA